MSRYIDADALKENCYKKMDELMESTSEHLSAEALSLLCGFTLIDFAPSIDIVRCQDCKHRTYCYGDVIWTNKRQTVDIHKTIDFCSYGEVRDE